MRTYNYTLDDVEHFAKFFAVLIYDPNAQRSLHFQCSSFYLADEMPEFADEGYDASIRHFMLYLLSYRKMLMYGEDVPAFLPLWNRLKECCPKWPGFRDGRMDALLIPDLEAETEKHSIGSSARLTCANEDKNTWLASPLMGIQNRKPRNNPVHTESPIARFANGERSPAAR